jgi:hypothetical protein
VAVAALTFIDIDRANNEGGKGPDLLLEQIYVDVSALAFQFPVLLPCRFLATVLTHRLSLIAAYENNLMRTEEEYKA